MTTTKSKTNPRDIFGTDITPIHEDIGFIHGLGYYTVSEDMFEKYGFTLSELSNMLSMVITDMLRKDRVKVVFAITSSRQVHAEQALKKLKFKKVCSALSTHSNGTTITVWIKTRIFLFKKTRYSETFQMPYNCSVRLYTVSNDTHLNEMSWYPINLVIERDSKGKENLKTDLKRLNFQKILNTPLWYKIR